MEPSLIKILHGEKAHLKARLNAVNRLIQLSEDHRPPTFAELRAALLPPDHAQPGFPHFGTHTERIAFVVGEIGRFCRKEAIFERLEAYQPGKDLKALPSVLSRMVKDGRLASLKYNRSNLFVFYGLPSFLKLPKGEVKRKFEPLPSEIADIRVAGITVNCGGILE